MSTILEFSSVENHFVEEVGSKAYALIEMTQKGFPVPPGFVLAVSFFEPWTKRLQSSPEWVAVMKADPHELGQAAQALKALCRDLEFTPQQDEALAEILSLQATNPESLFAVRSSSPEEDLEGASFAGGYETSLGVTTETMREAILHSFTSSFDARIFLYKQEHGIDISQPRIAVIVQQQIAAETAGVAFSVNPLNNCYDEAVINANFGLGESVVSGVVEPDLFVVDKLTQEILQTQIGKKETVISLAKGGGIEMQSRPQDTEACLTPQQVTQLTDLLIKIENDYQHPVDIEWAFFKDELYLLQVRPITTYLPLPEEMITKPGQRKRLYADSTLIEQGVHEPLSVLGTEYMRYILNTMTGPMGSTADSVEGGAFTAGGRYYMNLSESLRLAGPAGGLAPGSAGDETVIGILENMDTDQYLAEKKSPGEMLKTIAGPLKMIPRMVPVMKALRNPDWVLDNYHRELPQQLQQIEQIMAAPRTTMHELATELTGKLHFFFYEYGVTMVFAGQIAQLRIKKIFEDDLDQVREHLLRLGTALPGNKTSEMGAMMAELAASDTLKAYPTTAAFLKALDQRTLDADFLQRWDVFIAEFGSRCPREIDVATPRLNEDPALLFEQLKRMSSAQQNTTGAAAIFEEANQMRASAYAALYELALAKGKKQAKTLEKLYKTWVTLGAYRETPKHYVIQIVDLFRKRTLEVADTFVQAGRLDDRDQIFDLTINDIDQALADSQLDLRKIAAERVVLINKIKRSPYVARIIDSRGKIFFPPRKAAQAGELAGVPISAGVVRGRVKVLRSADEKPLLPGEILVTRATDPGWTPLFINAGGVILEIGGALQHGAVVAREYGLPCVSGITQATEMLQDGQLVEVDGSHGIVRVLEGEIEYSHQRTDFATPADPEAEARIEKARSKRKRQQTLLRILPVLLLPIVLPIIFVTGFLLINLLMGYSVSAAMMRLEELWLVGSPYVMGFTNIIGITVLLAALWRNRKKLISLVTKNRK